MKPKITKLRHWKDYNQREEKVVLQNGTVIWNPGKGKISSEAIFGKNCMIGANCTIDWDVEIGDNTKIQSDCFLPPGTRIGNNCFLAPGVKISNDHYPPSDNLRGAVIEDEVFVFINSTILGGVKIGRGSIIGAGSVVTKDIDPLQVWYGNPARFKYLAKEYWENKKNFG